MDVTMTGPGVVDRAQTEVVETATDVVRLLAADRGDVQVAEYTSSDRDGPPPHRHPWHEVEYVLSGEVEFWIYGDWHRATAGDVQVLPVGSAHSVRIPEGEARVLMVTIGAPYDGFARDLAALPPDASGADVVAAAARYGVELA